MTIDKSLKNISVILTIFAAIVGIFGGIYGLGNSDGGSNNDNTIVNTGDHNNFGTIVKNEITSFFMGSSEKKDENTDSTLTAVDESKISENNLFHGESDTSVSGEDHKKFIYDEDFSLIGSVIQKYNDSYERDLEDGILRIDIPDDGDKYYQINLTTDDPESEVSICYYYTYNYEYKKDKFSDFISASGEVGGQRDYGLDGKAYFSGFGHADKMEDINTIIYVPPHWAGMLIKDKRGKVEPRLTDSNLSIQLDIPFHEIMNKQKVGESLTSNGHIRIEEIDKEEAGHDYFTI